MQALEGVEAKAREFIRRVVFNRILIVHNVHKVHCLFTPGLIWRPKTLSQALQRPLSAFEDAIDFPNFLRLMGIMAKKARNCGLKDAMKD